MTEHGSFKNDRRQGPDFIRRLFSWLAILAWLVFIVAIVLVHYARPELDTGLVRYWELDIRQDWHPTLTTWLHYVLWVTAALSGISLVLNRLRARRKGDRLHYNLLLLLLTSIALVLYLMRL
ncbi:MAG: hypothetical protein LAT66_09620 [Alkalimonas sp.]|nr:hypothetical protein [Alkalimonas sp.]